MNTFYSLVVGTVSSLAAMVIAFVFVRWRWPSVIGRISASRVFGHGVAFRYPNQKAAERDIIRSFQESRDISILCMRAFSVTQPERPFRFVLNDPQKNIRLLLADPGDRTGENHEIEERSRQYPAEGTVETYRRGVFSSIEAVLGAMRSNPNVTCHLHKLPAFARLYLCDDVAYLSFFVPGLSGSQLPVLAVRRSSPLYVGMSRFFDSVWSRHSRDVRLLQYTPA